MYNISRSVRPLSLERGSTNYLESRIGKSHARAIAAVAWPLIYLRMKTNTSGSSAAEIDAYVQLQHQIHDALREQHPEWIEENGESPICESYESRFAELLNLFQSREQASAA